MVSEGDYSLGKAEQEAAEIMGAKEDFVTITQEVKTQEGEREAVKKEKKVIPILEQHSVRFEKTYSNVIDAISNRFRLTGYHSWVPHEKEWGPPPSGETSVESNHPIEHAKAGVLRLHAAREIALGKGLSIDYPQGELEKLVGNTGNPEVDSKRFENLKSLLTNEESFNMLVEDQILISLMHDAEEVTGRGQHEEKAKKALLRLLKDQPLRFKYLEGGSYITIDSEGHEVTLSRLDYVLMGIDGSKMSTNLPPVDFESDINVEFEDEGYTIPRSNANSLASKLAVSVTQTCDWERTSSPEYSSIDFLDESLDKDAAKLEEALRGNALLLLAAEGRIEDRFAYFNGTASESITKMYGGAVNLLRGSESFYFDFVKKKMGGIDDWYSKTGMDSTIVDRYSLYHDVPAGRINVFTKSVEGASDDFLEKRVLQAALLLLGEHEIGDIANLSDQELEIEFNKANTEREKKLLKDRIRTQFSSPSSVVLFYTGKTEKIVKALVISDEIAVEEEGIEEQSLPEDAMGKHRRRFVLKSKKIGLGDEYRPETLEIFVMPPGRFVAELLDPEPEAFSERESVHGMTTYDVLRLVLETTESDSIISSGILRKKPSDLGPTELQYFEPRMLENLTKLQSQYGDLPIKDLVMKIHPELSNTELFKAGQTG